MRNDVDEFEDFFVEHYPRVRRALILAFGSIEVAEDAAQEAFIRACQRWPRIRSMDRPAAWVYVTATNVARDHHRRGARRAAAQERSAPADVAIDDTDAAIARIDVMRALEALPPRQRLAVVLRYLGELSNEEVARAMKCSVGTVKSTLHAALANLRVEFEEATL